MGSREPFRGAVAAPNPYEAPSCQETNFPQKRILPIFFRYASGQARSASGNVFRLHFRGWCIRRDCTKHLLRVCRHRDGGDREGWHNSLRPRNISVPSCRPLQKRG